MATVEPVITDVEEEGDVKVKQVFWEAMGNADTGSAVQLAQYPDKTIQVVGTFASATLAVEGSNDNTNWFALTDPGGTAISFTATGGKKISENPRYVRMSSSGGAGADLDVYMIATSSRGWTA